jgi:hypothetical protein
MQAKQIWERPRNLKATNLLMGKLSNELVHMQLFLGEEGAMGLVVAW